MLNTKDLETLKNRLPDDWVVRVQALVPFRGTKIRETLRNPLKYNKEIIDATILVAEQYELDEATVVAGQKQKIYSKPSLA